MKKPINITNKELITAAIVCFLLAAGSTYGYVISPKTYLKVLGVVSSFGLGVTLGELFIRNKNNLTK